MAKARKPSKKKKAATKSTAKKKAATKRSVKKATPKKKTAKKKAAKKAPKKAAKKIASRKSSRRTASRPFVESGAEPESVEAIPAEPPCKCKEKNGVFFLMVKQKNGKYKQSPLHAAFETLAECEANCVPE